MLAATLTIGGLAVFVSFLLVREAKGWAHSAIRAEQRTQKSRGIAKEYFDAADKLKELNHKLLEEEIKLINADRKVLRETISRLQLLERLQSNLEKLTKLADEAEEAYTKAKSTYKVLSNPAWEAQAKVN